MPNLPTLNKPIIITVDETTPIDPIALAELRACYDRSAKRTTRPVNYLLVGRSPVRFTKQGRVAMLRKLLALIQAVDPKQVQALITFISDLVAKLSGKTALTMPEGFSASAEQDEVVAECVKAGANEADCRALAAHLPND